MRFDDVDVNPKGQPFIPLNFSKTDQFGTEIVIPISDYLFDLLARWQKKIINGIEEARMGKVSPSSI